MKSIGLIAEYNPFHNGHLYQLQKIKELYKDYIIVLVLVGNFTQRGIPSVIPKLSKTKIALEAGIDLVVELPFAFATQSADFFAQGALSILENLNVDYLVFGSETDDINKLITLVDAQLNHEDFDLLTKVYLKLGENFPTALSKSLYDLTGTKVDLPNDLLGISYVKAIRKNNYNIKPICFKRVNNYHSRSLDSEFVSATALRESLQTNNNINKFVPEFSLKYLQKELIFRDDFFTLLKYKIITSSDLNIYQTVNNDFALILKKEVLKATTYDDLIKRVKSKRYTYNRISRMLLHILCDFKKKDFESVKDDIYIRVLGFNKLGRSYLNYVKKDVKVPIISKVNKNKCTLLEIELKSSKIYNLVFNNTYKEEYSCFPVVYRKDNNNDKN